MSIQDHPGIHHQSANPMRILNQFANPFTICQFWTNRQILHQFINSCQLRQVLHIIKAPVKSPPKHRQIKQLSSDWPSIGQKTRQSITNRRTKGAHNQGTSVLQGPTEVSHRGTISRQGHCHSIADRTSLQPLHSQSDVNSVTIHLQSVRTYQIYLKELVLYRANYSQHGIIFQPLSGVATRKSSANPSPV